jgi:hypothetical protein
MQILRNFRCIKWWTEKHTEAGHIEVHSNGQEHDDTINGLHYSDALPNKEVGIYSIKDDCCDADIRMCILYGSIIMRWAYAVPKN